MNPVLLAVVSVRAAALAASLAGRTVTASALYSLANLIESGKAVDDHLFEVAAKLNSRDLTDTDWSELANRIHADSARLRAG